MIQKTEWGYIEWFHTSEDDNSSMNVGITVVYPNKILPVHTHYGTEQFLYVLEGEGYYVINGIKHDFKVGDYFYLEADATHETVNTSNNYVKELVISSPVQYSADIFDAKKTSSDDLFKDAVYSIHTHSLNNLKLPYTILDNKNNILAQNNFFPEYCINNCLNEDAECLKRVTEDISKDEFVCDKGMIYYCYPIQYENVYLGLVVGGHIMLSETASTNDEDVFDTPKGTVLSIKKLLKQIAKNIINNYEFNISKQELLEKDIYLNISKEKEKELEKNIVEIENSVTNLKINHHFLFNTLNSMADLSLRSDNTELYNSIVSLSKIFRYTMSSELKIVKLEDEIAYVNDYLNLQKIRYQEMLDVSLTVDNNSLQYEVPFNFLQPIVENAFVHGFLDQGITKEVKIDIKVKDNYLEIIVKNNGKELTNQEVINLKNKIKIKSDHGLSLIYNKLFMVYDNKFIIDIKSNDNETSFIINLPILNEVKV